MVGALLLSMAALPVPDGPIALIEQGEGNDLRASGSGNALRLTGAATHVAWARHATHGGGVAVRRPPGAVRSARPARVTCSEQLDAARVCPATRCCRRHPCIAQAGTCTPLSQPVWALGALARSVMMVGALESALDQSVRYANERVQFGRPIGKNQALQQQLALMAGDWPPRAWRRFAVPVRRRAQHRAGRRAVAAAFSIAVAKVRCGEAATRATGIAHQVHGAIGFTREHSLHFATRRLWAWREQFGTDAPLGRALGPRRIICRRLGALSGLPLTQRRVRRRFDERSRPSHRSHSPTIAPAP